MNTPTRALTGVVMVILAVALATAQVKESKPVTDAMLHNPDSADWLNWRRTLDGWGYSPLTQINRQNVSQLQLACVFALPERSATATR